MRASTQRLEIRDPSTLEVTLASWRAPLGLSWSLHVSDAPPSRDLTAALPETVSATVGGLAASLEPLEGRRVLVWIDASTVGPDELRRVLATLNRSGHDRALVVIDGLASLEEALVASGRTAHELAALLGAVRTLGSHRVSVLFDRAIAVPLGDPIQASPGLAAMTASRTHTGEAQHVDLLLLAERPLTKLPATERAVIAAQAGTGTGRLRAHTLYWQALALLGEGRVPDALDLLGSVSPNDLGDDRPHRRAAAVTQAAGAG